VIRQERMEGGVHRPSMRTRPRGSGGDVGDPRRGGLGDSEKGGMNVPETNDKETWH